MVDINELWIGDQVLIISSNKKGKFEGIGRDGKARIWVESKMLLVTANNLQKIEEKEIYPDIHEMLKEDLIESKSSQPLKISIDHTIDLHIDKLAPHMEGDKSGRILEYQRQKCEDFIKNAIQKNYPKITIIHGKGQGILKLEIEHLLKQYRQVKFSFSLNGGGAVEVWLTK